MTNLLRKTLTSAVAALSLGALVVATASPAAAQWRGHRHGGGWGGGGAVAAGVVGALALGALAAGSNRGYAYGYGAPVYAEPEPYYPAAGYVDQGYYAGGYGPVCHKEWRPVYRADGGYVRDRLVRVCN